MLRSSLSGSDIQPCTGLASWTCTSQSVQTETIRWEPFGQYLLVEVAVRVSYVYDALPHLSQPADRAGFGRLVGLVLTRDPATQALTLLDWHSDTDYFDAYVRPHDYDPFRLIEAQPDIGVAEIMAQQADGKACTEKANELIASVAQAYPPDAVDSVKAERDDMYPAGLVIKKQRLPDIPQARFIRPTLSAQRC